MSLESWVFSKKCVAMGREGALGIIYIGRGLGIIYVGRGLA